MLKMIMIIIVIRIDATQISFRTGQLSLFEKETKYFPFSPLTLPPPPPPFTPTQHTNPSYLLLNRRLLPWLRTEVAGNRG